MNIYSTKDEFIAHSLMLITWTVQQHEKGMNIEEIRQKYLKMTKED